MNEKRSMADHGNPASRVNAGEAEAGNATAFEVLLEAANQRAEAALNDQRAMRESMSWRVTAPLRSVPAPLRVKLRRVAKAAWWALTFWRMPQRLRVMRVKPAPTA